MLGKVTQRSFHLVVVVFFFAQFHQGWWCSEITLMVGGQEKEGANLFPGCSCIYHGKVVVLLFWGQGGFHVCSRETEIVGGWD